MSGARGSVGRCTHLAFVSAMMLLCAGAARGEGESMIDPRWRGVLIAVIVAGSALNLMTPLTWNGIGPTLLVWAGVGMAGYILLRWEDLIGL